MPGGGPWGEGGGMPDRLPAFLHQALQPLKRLMKIIIVNATISPKGIFNSKIT